MLSTVPRTVGFLGAVGLLAVSGAFSVRSAHAGPAEVEPESTGSVTAFAGAEPVDSAAPADLVRNGSFEAPQSPRPGLVGTFAAIPGWRETTGHGVEIQNGISPAPDGTQYVELDSKAPASIYQDVATVPGTQYRLSFSYAAHPAADAAESSFDVTFGDATQSIAPAPDPIAVWRTSSMDVRATETVTRLTFADNSGPDAVRGLGAFLDLVSVVALP